MITKTLAFFTAGNIDAIDQFANRLGLSSIAASLGLTISKGMVAQPWVLTDYALLISCVGGVLFIIEKLFVIYIRYRESQQIAKDAKQKRKSRNLP